MNLRITNLRQLQQRPLGEVRAIMGPKVAGNVWMRKQQKHCPARYTVLGGQAIPAAGAGYALHAEQLHEAMLLLAGTRPVLRMRDARFYRVPLLLRSSHLHNEGSGRQESPVVIYDHADPRGSFARLYQKVSAMREDPGMGLLLQRMMGSPKALADGRIVWAYDLVSGVGESHNPYVPNEMLLSFGSGLGNTVVVPSQGSPLNATFNALTGKLTQVSNRAPHLYLQENQDVSPVMFADDYAQKVRAVCDLASGEIVDLPITDRDLESMKRYLLRDGEISVAGRGFHMSDVRISVRGVRRQDLGKLPLSSPRRLQQWFSVLQYLRGAESPMQLEGAFLPGRGARLYVFQALPVPFPQGHVELTIRDPDMRSDMVLGFGDVHCPLVIYRGHGAHLTAQEAAWLRDYDAKLHAAHLPYAVYAGGHVGEVIKATPNASMRLDQHPQMGVTTHPITDIRLRMGRRNGMPMFFAANVEVDHEAAQGVAQPISAKLSLIPKAHLQANSRCFLAKFATEE